MNTLVSSIKQHALEIFCALTIALTFAVTLLPLPGEAVPVVIVFIPAFMAICLTALSEGKAGVRSLLGKLAQWRVSFKWVIIAWALALVMRLTISLAASCAPFAGHDIRRLAAPANPTATHRPFGVDHLALRADKWEYPVDQPVPCRAEFLCHCQRGHTSYASGVVNGGSLSGAGNHHHYCCWVKFFAEALGGDFASDRSRTTGQPLVIRK